MLDALPDVLYEHIVSLLDGRTLGVLGTARPVSETQWQRACRSRFLGAAKSTPRMCGGSTWAKAYRELERRCAPPRTSLTPRHARIFAKGRSRDCAMWVLVAHSHNCRTRGVIQLRVLVQNVGADVVKYDIGTLNVSWLCCQRDVTRECRAAVAPARVVAGCELDELTPYAWAVLGIDVGAPDCEFELDFLERATRVDLDVVEKHGGRATVRAPFVACEQLYAWYSVLPGGYVTLAPMSGFGGS